MKPTGATKEATNHSPLPWRAYKSSREKDKWYVAEDSGDTPAYETSITGWGCVQQSEANAKLIVTAVNERERLRAAIQRFVDAYSDGKEARLGNGQARRSLDEFRRLLNDATTSTSAGEG